MVMSTEYIFTARQGIRDAHRDVLIKLISRTGQVSSVPGKMTVQCAETLAETLAETFAETLTEMFTEIFADMFIETLIETLIEMLIETQQR